MTNEELPTIGTATGLGVPQYVDAWDQKIQEGDELVRRKDVEKLIEDKIKEFNEGRPPEYPQKALKEILDKVQSQ